MAVKNIDDELAFHITADNLKCRVSGRVPLGYTDLTPREDGVFESRDGLLAGQMVKDALWLGKGTINLVDDIKVHFENDDYKFTYKNGILTFEVKRDFELSYLNFKNGLVGVNSYMQIDSSDGHCFQYEIVETKGFPDGVTISFNKGTSRGGPVNLVGPFRKFSTTWSDYPGFYLWRSKVGIDEITIPAGAKFVVKGILAEHSSYCTPPVVFDRPDANLIYEGFDDWRNKSLAIEFDINDEFSTGRIEFPCNISGNTTSKHVFYVEGDKELCRGKRVLSIFRTNDNGELSSKAFLKDGTEITTYLNNFNVTSDNVLNFTHTNTSNRPKNFIECKQWSRLLHQDEINSMVEKFLDPTPKPCVSYDFAKSLEDQCGNSKLLGYDNLTPSDSGIISSANGDLVAQQVDGSLWIGRETVNIAAINNYSCVGHIVNTKREGCVFTATYSYTEPINWTRFGQRTQDISPIAGEVYTVTWNVLSGKEYFKYMILKGQIYGSEAVSSSKLSGSLTATIMEDFQISEWAWEVRVDKNRTDIPDGAKLIVEVQFEKSTYPSPIVPISRDDGKIIMSPFTDFRNKTFVIEGDIQHSTPNGLVVIMRGTDNGNRAHLSGLETAHRFGKYRAVVTYDDTGSPWHSVLYANGERSGCTTHDLFINIGGSITMGNSKVNEIYGSDFIRKFKFYDQVLTAVQCEQLLYTGTLEQSKNTKLEDSCTFYTVDGEVTDRVSGITPEGYSSISCKDKGCMDNMSHSCAFQVTKDEKGEKGLFIGDTTENLFTIHEHHFVNENTKASIPIHLFSNYIIGDWQAGDKYSIIFKLEGSVSENLLNKKLQMDTYPDANGGKCYIFKRLIDDKTIADESGILIVDALNQGWIKTNCITTTDIINGYFRTWLLNGSDGGGGTMDLKLTLQVEKKTFSTPYVIKERRKSGKINYRNIKLKPNFAITKRFSNPNASASSNQNGRGNIMMFSKDFRYQDGFNMCMLTTSIYDVNYAIAIKNELYGYRGSYVYIPKDKLELDNIVTLNSNGEKIDVWFNGILMGDCGTSEYINQLVNDVNTMGEDASSYACPMSGIYYNTSIMDKTLTVDEIKELHERKGYLDIESKGEYMPVPYSTPARDDYGSIRNYYTITNANSYELPVKKGYIAIATFATGEIQIADLDTGVSNLSIKNSILTWDDLANKFNSWSNMTSIIESWDEITSSVELGIEIVGNYWRATSVSEDVPYTVKYYKK